MAEMTTGVVAEMSDASAVVDPPESMDYFRFVSNNTIRRPGDVIATGPPGGVGHARTPPVFMQAGAVACCPVEGIGTLSNQARRWLDVMPR